MVTMMTDVQPLLSEGGLQRCFCNLLGGRVLTSTHSFLLFSRKTGVGWCWVEMPIRLVQKRSTVTLANACIDRTDPVFAFVGGSFLEDLQICFLHLRFIICNVS